MTESFRTWLYAPGDRPDRCIKALASEADQVIWDLEDAVREPDKLAARETLVKLLVQEPLTRMPWIRLNALDTPWGTDDLLALSEAFGTRTPRWVIPKTTRATIETLRCLGMVGEWLLIIESAAGLRDVWQMARPWQISGVTRLAFGSLDYRNDIGALETPDESELTMPRSLLVWASRVWGWPAPIDAVYPAIEDGEAIRTSAWRGRSLGMAGKMVIHPRQISPVQEAYAPTDQEIAWARDVLRAAEGGGAVKVQGEMVDRPVIERARRLIRDAGLSQDAE